MTDSTAQREVASLARRLTVRFEERQLRDDVIRRLLTGWQPDAPNRLWWRNSGRTSAPMSDREVDCITQILVDTAGAGAAGEPDE